MKRAGALVLVVATACGTAIDAAADPGASTTTAADPGASATTGDNTPGLSPTTTDAAPPPTFPPAPAFPDGPLDTTTEDGLESLLSNVFTSAFDASNVAEVVDGGDIRAAWLIADLLRFYQGGPDRDELVRAFTQLTGIEYVPSRVDFVWAFNNLIAWDMPTWDGYADLKRRLYTPIEPLWEPFFDEDQGVDWRLVTWGGVRADGRPLGDNGPCNCIPSLDNPATTDAAGGSWYADDRIVFGVVVNGEALALPKHQMEVHEMVNITLGGRDLGIPYCTLCGSAQAYVTDNVEGFDRVVLRTSGLLSRSNKVMYDVTTGSMFDTFTGRALTGPLGQANVVLEQVSVVGARWGEWKAAQPNTRILAEDGGIGRVYRDDPLGSRDAAGPIFPVGDIDPRLPVQEAVVGVIRPDGVPIAFPVDATTDALAGAGQIEFEGVVVRLTDGLRVFTPDGTELITHQAFWFAWSQFNPETLVWTPAGS
jgi:Protein of unknown function (DUF3179)